MAKAKSMLLFMPWCKLDRAYQVGEIELLPYSRHDPSSISGLDITARNRVDRIMGMYKTIEGNPVDWAAMIRFVGKPLLSVLDDEELSVTDELVTVACFTALSKRQYFGVPAVYCNSDCFLFHVQKFDDAKFVAFSSRRRAGRVTDMGYPPTEVSITVPMNCHNIDQVTLDEDLLAALLKQRAGGNDWGRWQNAMSCFNQANTDSSTVKLQMEWVLLCSAFEHLLDAKSKAKDVACKFTVAFQPSQDVLAQDANRRSDRWKDLTKSLRFEWLQEFYRVRGDFAHGKLVTKQPMVWNPWEHLLLATVAFPVVVKSLLHQRGHYQLSDSDKAQTDIFERFADTKDFLRPPPDQKGSNDSHWSRLFYRRKSDIALSEGSEEAAKKLEQKFPDLFDDGAEGSTG